MKLTRLILPGVVLAASGLWVMAAGTFPTNSVERLPASSPYGEARVIRNIPYVDHPAARQNFDLYLPPTGNEKYPVMVWIHGGAWMMGIKEWDNVKYLVRHGYAIASIDYRLSTEVKFPAQIQDCNAALNFIRAHAGEYGLDTNRVVVGGGSAGGHLALLLGLARSESSFGADASFKPRAILDFFGPTDFLHQIGDMQSAGCTPHGFETVRDANEKLLGGPPETVADKARQASPITYAGATSPPVLILQGEKDDFVPVSQSRRLYDSLRQAGINSRLVILPGVGHDGPPFSAPDIETNVVAFLKPVLR